ncbi:hypothetical protein [Methylosinus sp. LW4]|uniref:hypothetical protein n=1 Tax=Methylosinus sp. LW4 TaxID=136993 RepID=UPI000382DAF3|nr:hypothetical protein [Methylosinus sp. LW4]
MVGAALDAEKPPLCASPFVTTAEGWTGAAPVDATDAPTALRASSGDADVVGAAIDAEKALRGAPPFATTAEGWTGVAPDAADAPTALRASFGGADVVGAGLDAETKLRGASPFATTAEGWTGVAPADTADAPTALRTSSGGAKTGARASAAADREAAGSDDRRPACCGSLALATLGADDSTRDAATTGVARLVTGGGRRVSLEICEKDVAAGAAT